MDSKVAGNSERVPKEVQFSKACLPILVSCAGKVTEANEEQSAKADVPISVTDSGKVMVAKAEFLAKSSLAMPVIAIPSAKPTLLSPSHPLNAAVPSSVTVAGIVSEESLLHWLKAYSLTAVVC